MAAAVTAAGADHDARAGRAVGLRQIDRQRRRRARCRPWRRGRRWARAARSWARRHVPAKRRRVEAACSGPRRCPGQTFRSIRRVHPVPPHQMNPRIVAASRFESKPRSSAFARTRAYAYARAFSVGQHIGESTHGPDRGHRVELLRQDDGRSAAGARDRRSLRRAGRALLAARLVRAPARRVSRRCCPRDRWRSVGCRRQLPQRSRHRLAAGDPAGLAESLVRVRVRPCAAADVPSGGHTRADLRRQPRMAVQIVCFPANRSSGGF